MPYLILVRHGESRWNLVNKFTGWVDVPLSKRGVKEALATAKKLKNIKIDHAFVSNLERARETLTIILSQQELTGIFLHHDEKKESWYSCEHHSDKTEILTHTTALLNERYYGKLQGLNKNDVRKKYGEKKVVMWRRGYDVKPPGGESLRDVYNRAVPFFIKNIIPILKRNRNVVIASHGNTLRALIKYIDKVSSEHLPHLNLPYGKPFIYRYSNNKFSLSDKYFTFDRPVFWNHEKSSSRSSKSS